MLAVYQSHYGNHEVMEVKNLPDLHPAEKQVLIKVMCTTVNRTDVAMSTGKPYVNRLVAGFPKPKKKTPGTDFAGIIVNKGSEVTLFNQGDKVFGFSDLIISSQAEYMLLDEDGKIALIPENTTFEMAAASCEGPHYALNMLKYIDLKKGDKVLVNGASGGIGSALIQLLKLKDAEVTAVADTKNTELINSFGVDHFIDYLKEDFTKQNIEYRFILDAVGKSSFKKCKAILAPDGKYISSELGKNGINILLALTNKRVSFPIPNQTKKSIESMRKLLAEGKYKPIIDKRYPLNEVKEAYRYVGAGLKTGNVILTISSEI